MDLQRLLNAIMKKSWLIVLCAIVGGSLATYVSLFMTKPMYQTSTTLYILNRSSSVLSGNSINLSDIALSRQLISDFGNIIQTRKVLEPALAELNDPELTVGAIASATSVHLMKESNVVSIIVTWPEPEQAARIANAVSRSFTSEISKLMGQNSIGTLDQALVPERPLPSKRSVLLVVGVMAGAIIAVGLIYVRALFDNTIYSAADIERGTDLKVMGIIPEHNIS
ncbi:YveK family protein [Paenibacillus sp. YYML68]|uniref:YveK family protein n=1 Tax=Paenibacillus sp. YYML68 TaxID=2909250 RepID=UPI002491DBD0|nr:Wzz/FepE/Etk N-terminal domain-containing protein [Paenibacillus sp. YYML68]